MLSETIEITGWTLLHFVWQGFAAVVLLATLLLMLRRATAHARYLSACGVFALMTLAPLVTSWWLSTQPRNIVEATEAEPRRVGRVIETHQTIASDVVGLDDSTHPTATATATAERLDFGQATLTMFGETVPIGSRTQAASATPSEPQPSWLEENRSLMERHLGWIVAVWLLGVTVLSLRLFAGWLSVQRLRRRSSLPASDSWQTLLRRSAERLRVSRPVKLVESALVEVPTVIGWLSPMILLPASAMTGLTTEQLEALLAHELAHVRRHDYLINLLQTVVETLLFYHPAVWWISHRIRVEREHCCDDLAVQVCGDGLTYAKALVALEELRAPKLGLAMSSSGGSLLTRVARLLGQAEQQRRPTGWVAGLLSFVLLTMAGALGAGLLTPPDKPTAGLPNDPQPMPTESTEAKEETSGPTQRRGQETRAERESVANERQAGEVIDPKDQLATQLALRAHAQAAAISKLPRFSYRVHYRHGIVDSMRAIDDPSLDQHKQGLTALALDEDWYGWFGETLAWDEKRFLSEHRYDESKPAGILSFCFWTATEGWSRNETSDRSVLTFTRHSGPEMLWRHSIHLFEYGYLRLPVHRFWWGDMVHSGHQPMTVIPPEKATWKHLGVEQFGDELCDIVESALHAQRIWIGQDSGHLRGVAIYYPKGGPIDETWRISDEVQRIAGRKFATQFDYAQWSYSEANADQKRQVSLVWNKRRAADFPANSRVNELAQFDDYREVSPGVWLPFFEVRTFTHASDTVKGKSKLKRSELKVERVRTDRDLAERYAELLPKDGDKVQDQRFSVAVEYRDIQSPNRTDHEIREWADRESRKLLERQVDFKRMEQAIAAMVGKPAPQLPADGWVGGERPDLTGKQYLLHFWAMWSYPRRIDVPLLKQLSESGVSIVGMHPSGTSSGVVETFLRDQNFVVPTFVATDSQVDANNPKVGGYPTGVYPYYVLVDAKGNVAGHGLLSELRGRLEPRPPDLNSAKPPLDSRIDSRRGAKNGEKTNQGDLRSNAAAGSGDPRRAQVKRNSVRERLQNRISLAMENAPLSQVIEHIGREAKIDVRLHSDALEESGIGTDTPVSISVDGISTAIALQLLLQPIQLGYLIENETLLVTSAARIAKTPVEVQLDLGETLADEAKMSGLKDAIQSFVEPKSWDVAGGPGSIRLHASREEFVVRHVPSIQHEVDRFLTHVLPRPPTPESLRLRKLLAQRFTLELGEVALLDAVRKIATAADANVVLDESGLHAVGVRSKQRVTLSQKDAPLRDILDGLCKPLKLRFQIRNEVIRITDEQTAQGGFVAVLYPISTPADDLANRLQKSIRPESWKSTGGKGTIEPHLPTNSLIIRQHEDVHDEIDEFFAKLILPNADMREATGRFVGRVRLKTEKPLPDLEKVVVPAGKVLDESLVFSKDGGLANVFVYLWRPKFPIQETAGDPRKAFALTSSGGRFVPHLALVRVGQPLEFVNADKAQLNFRTMPLKNVAENRLVPPETRLAVPAFNVAENLPIQVGSNMHPWMSAYLLPLDHPFAAVTDADGRFSINGLPPGEHELRVWHERVGYLQKKLVVTIKPGEESRIELEYEPSRLKLEAAEVLNWNQRFIETPKMPRPLPRVPQPAAQPEDKNAKVDAANRRVREELQKLTDVAFAETPFRDLLIYLRDYHNIPITLDASLRERAKVLGNVLVTFTSTGEDLGATLLRILHAQRLSYFVEAGELRITTPDEVRRLGHPVPESFAETLIKLKAADAALPWEGWLLGRKLSGEDSQESKAKQFEAVKKLLSHSDIVVQRHATFALARSEEIARARPDLEKLTKSADRIVRQAAWQALLAIGRDDLSTWPLFLEAWHNKDECVREQWINTLSNFHPKVFDELLAIFPTSTVEFRRACSLALRLPRDRPSYEQLAILAMADNDEETRFVALQRARSESRSQPFLSSWRRRLKDDSPRCRVLAASYLLPLESDHLDALDVLLDELGSADESRWPAAAQVITAYATNDYSEQFRDRLLRRSVSGDEAQRTVARKALKFVPESRSHSAILQEIDAQLQNVREDQRFPLAKRLELLDELGRDRMNPKGSEELRSRVGHHLAHYFAKWDLVAHNARVREYCLAALKLDVDPIRRASLFSLVGSAALVDPTTTSFAEQRRNAAKLWLTGYREIALLKLPKDAPERAIVLKIGDTEGESSEQRADRMKELDAQLEARRQAEFVRQMVEHRRQLARMCVENYQRDPADEPELRKLATEALIDKSLVDALLAEGAIPLVGQPAPAAGREPPSAERAGRGSPDPAQNPTEGLPDSEDDAKREQKNVEKTTKGDLRSDEAAGSGDPRRAQAIERAVAFLKGQQAEGGLWRELQPSMNGGVSSLCTLALLQAGVKPEDAVIQKALASLRKIKPDKTYTVALQTMVFCSASPKEDAELIRQNVAWLEKTQIAVGLVQGGWSYQAGSVGSGDGSNTRFAVMSLLAAKKAGFDVQAETWQRVSEYYLTTQTAEGGWGYSGPGQASLSMTLAGVAGLASANRYLPQNEQRKARDAALLRSAEYLEKKLLIEGTVPATLYALHCLERAGHVSGQTQFDKLGWTADSTKRLLDQQGPNGSWSGTGAGENTELIGTSFALMCLTGQPEPKQNTRADRGTSKPAPNQADRITDSESQQAAEAVERWRESTDRLASYEAELSRWEYDYVFNLVKRGEGTFRWQGTDSWQLELRPKANLESGTEQRKHWDNGQLTSFRIQAGQSETWSRQGDMITWEDGRLAEGSPGKRNSLRVPQESPRPKGFWGNVAAQWFAEFTRVPCFLPPVKESQHKIQITRRDDNELWLVLQPTDDEASSYQHLTVILDQQTSLLRAVRLIDPAGTRETVITYRSPRIEWKQEREEK